MRRPNVVQRLCSNRKSRGEILATSLPHWFTTKSDGMWQILGIVLDAHGFLPHGTHRRVARANAQMDTPRSEAIQGGDRGDLHRWQACATDGSPRAKT